MFLIDVDRLTLPRRSEGVIFEHFLKHFFVERRPKDVWKLSPRWRPLYGVLPTSQERQFNKLYKNLSP